MRRIWFDIKAVLSGAVAAGTGRICGNWEMEYQFLNPLKLFMCGLFISSRPRKTFQISCSFVFFRFSVGWQRESFNEKTI